jgi:hypothetical protein
MAVNAEVQTFPRRGITLSPLGLILMTMVVAAAVVTGVLVGRATAPSTTKAQQAAIAAPRWEAVANSAGYRGRLGFTAPVEVTGSNAWVPAATQAGFTGRLGFTTPIQGPPSGWEQAAKDAGYTGRLGTSTAGR